VTYPKFGAMRRQGTLAAVVACMCLPSLSSAQAAPERAIRARQAGYYLMGLEMARIGATVKGDLAFDRAALETSAEALDVIGRLVVDNYPTGSDQGSTKAKPEVWSETPRFKQFAQASQSEAARLRAAVRGGDLDAIKVAYGAMSKSCKSCHDVYRAR
jgi:cytochrome c556